MEGETTAHQHARRNRMIAIAAGAITVIAIVLAFASGYLGEQWQWLRPAGELLLLAELVGLIVLERHQLFEPVSERVIGIESRVAQISDALAAQRADFKELSQRIDASGQVSFLPDPSETTRALTRVLREALLRHQDALQILRWARLTNVATFTGDPDIGGELLEMQRALVAFGRQPGGQSDPKLRMWSVRSILTFTGLESFDSWREHIVPDFFDSEPLNFEGKALLRASHSQPVLTPTLVTDHDAIVTLDNDTARHRCGFLFLGRQYVAVFAHQFDELWASIPDSYLIQSRSGWNEGALDRIRRELEAAEALGERRTG